MVLDRAAADAQREAAPRTGEGRLLGKAFSQFVEIEQLRCDFPDNKKSISSAAAAPYYTPDDECKGNGNNGHNKAAMRPPCLNQDFAILSGAGGFNRRTASGRS